MATTERSARQMGRQRSESSRIREPEHVGFVEKAFYNYGLFVERRWWVTVFIGIVIIGFSLNGLYLGVNEIGSEDHALEKIWSPAWGRLREELEYTWAHDRTEWKFDYEALMFTEKDKSKGHEIGEGGYVLSAANLEDVLTVVKALSNLTFTADGKTYTSRDVCSRQILPDTAAVASSCEALETVMPVCNMAEKICSGTVPAPAGPNGTEGSCDHAQMAVCYKLFKECKPPQFPCIWASPLECFSEALEYQDPIWQYYETGGGNPEYVDLTQAMFDKYWRGLGITILYYSKRPSFRSSSNDEIKNEILNTPRDSANATGCDAFLKGKVIRGIDIVGGVGGEAALMRWDHDAEKRISWRMKDTKPNYTIKATIDAMKKTIPETVAQELERIKDKLAKTRVADLRSDAFSATTTGGMSSKDFLLSFLFLILCLLFFFGDPWSPFTSHADVALVGGLLVLTSIPAGIGLISWMRLPFTNFNWQTCPFLALGLGVNDLILMLSVFCHVDRRGGSLRQGGGEVAIVMLEAGTGITLTSVCNVVVFSLGSLTDIPGISSFCACAAVFAGMNWVVMMLIGPALLVYDNWRIKNSRPEFLLYCFHARRLRKCGVDTLPRDNNEAMGFIEFSVHRFVSKYWSHLLAKPCVRVTLSLVSVGIFIICFVGALGMDVGYEVHELFPTGSTTHYALNVWQQHFTTFAGGLCFKDGIDWPAQQVQVIDLLDDLAKLKKDNGKHVLATPGPVWIKKLANYAVIDEVMCSVRGQTNCDNFKDFDGSDGNPNSPVYRFSHPVHAPNGLVDPDKFYTVHAGWATWPPKVTKPPFYALGDLAGVFKFALQNNDEAPAEDNRITYACHSITAQNLLKTPDLIEAIAKVRKTITDSPLKDVAYPSGTMYTFWEIFVFLLGRTWMLIGVMVAVIFFFTVIFTRSFRPALIVSFGAFAIVIEIWGIVSTFLKFSYFVSTPLIMAGGLSIEFTAHLGSIFSRREGSLRDRLNFPMQIALVPTWMGAVTTVLSILPLAWSPIPFIVKYFFLIFVTIEVVGLLNTFVFLPAMLACLLPTTHLTDLCKKNGGSSSHNASEVVDDPEVPAGFPVMLGSDPTEAGGKCGEKDETTL